MNEVADILSRKMEGSCMALSRPVHGVLENIRATSVLDPELCQLRFALKENQQEHGDYKEQEGLIVFKGRIVVQN